MCLPRGPATMHLITIIPAIDAVTNDRATFQAKGAHGSQPMVSLLPGHGTMNYQ